jgi:uncharacterized protein (TIGR02444 family)
MRQEGAARRQAGESLWRFSLALYTRPGVAAALIGLQDRAGRDVNLVLFALWLGAVRGCRIGAAQLAAAAAAIAPLDAGIVQKLRRLRRELKGATDSDTEALRRRILGVELAAERQVLRRLAAALPDACPEAGTMPLAAAEANLALYLGEETRSAEADVLRQAVAGLVHTT